MSAADDPAIVDLAYIAETLGVSTNTVHSWRRRNLGFPEPSGRVAGRPYWIWREVKEWATKTGRA